MLLSDSTMRLPSSRPALLERRPRLLSGSFSVLGLLKRRKMLMSVLAFLSTALRSRLRAGRGSGVCGGGERAEEEKKELRRFSVS